MITKLRNIQVGIRVRDDICRSTAALPAARATTEVASTRSLMVSQEESQSNFEFDCCVRGAGDDATELLGTRLDLETNLASLLDGYSVGIVGISGEGEKPGAFSPLLLQILHKFGQLLESFREAEQLAPSSIELSYAIYGLTDTSCIDLTCYSRLDVEDVEAIVSSIWAPLLRVEGVKEVSQALEQGYSLPCVTLVRVLVRRPSRPTTISTLLLADLGFLGSGAPLEKSLAHIRAATSNLANNNEPFTETMINTSSQPLRTSLSIFLEDFLEGGNGHTVIIGDVAQVSTSRSLQSQLSFLTTLRRLRTRPVPTCETPEMRELAQLLQQHERLELEHQSVRQELKCLQKALKVAELQHAELAAERTQLEGEGEVRRAEYEWELTKVAMEKVAVHERIRKCEIDLVKMEAERLFLLAEMEQRKMALAEMEERLRISQEEKASVARKFEEKVANLAQQLDGAQDQLLLAQKEKHHLEEQLKGSADHVASLEGRIREVQQQMDIRHAENLREQTAELKKLRTELAVAQESEGQLTRKLAILEKNSSTHQETVYSLEAKLMELKVENATLTAKLEVFSSANAASKAISTVAPVSSPARKPQSPEINRTLRIMEEKWQEERKAMRDVVDELRQIIASKDQVLAANLVLPAEPKPVLYADLRKLPFEEEPKASPKVKGVPSSRVGLSNRSEAGNPNRKIEAEAEVEVEAKVEVMTQGQNRRPRGRPSKTAKPEAITKQAIAVAKAHTFPKPIEALRLGQTKRKRKAILNEDTDGNDEGTAINLDAERSRDEIPLEKILPLPVSKTLEGSKKEETIIVTKKEGGVRLGPKSKTNSTISSNKKLQLTEILKVPQGTAHANSEGATFAPADAIETDEVPGTPQKSKKASGATATTWKPSAFIPGVAVRKPNSTTTTTGEVPTLATGLFANFNFNSTASNNGTLMGGRLSGISNGGGLAKRIKLPNVGANSKEGMTTNKPLTLETRKANIDPVAFSTIMGSFSVPPLKK